MYPQRMTDRNLEETEERVESILETACRETGAGESRSEVIRTPRANGLFEAEFELRFSRVEAWGTDADVQQAIADALRALADRVWRVGDKHDG